MFRGLCVSLCLVDTLVSPIKWPVWDADSDVPNEPCSMRGFEIHTRERVLLGRCTRPDVSAVHIFNVIRKGAAAMQTLDTSTVATFYCCRLAPAFQQA